MTVKKSVLLVEDQKDLAETLRFNLEREGYRCQCVFDGRSALNTVERERPDLIVLDRMLPEISGDAVATQLKRDPSLKSIPIIMLTAKADEIDELVGFALGADDYVTKPFSIKALVARVGAIIRRAELPEAKADRLTGGPFVIDQCRHEVTVGEWMVELTATEFRILQTLISAGGRVLSRTHLIDAVLGATVAVTDRTIDVHIAALRRKVRAGSPSAPDWIQTVRGVGYTFRSPSKQP